MKKGNFQRSSTRASYSPAEGARSKGSRAGSGKGRSISWSSETWNRRSTTASSTYLLRFHPQRRVWPTIPEGAATSRRSMDLAKLSMPAEASLNNLAVGAFEKYDDPSFFLPPPTLDPKVRSRLVAKGWLTLKGGTRSPLTKRDDVDLLESILQSEASGLPSRTLQLVRRTRTSSLSPVGPPRTSGTSWRPSPTSTQSMRRSMSRSSSSSLIPAWTLYAHRLRSHG